MNDADRKAFEDWWDSLPGKDNGFEKSIAELAWQAACEWRDSQALRTTEEDPCPACRPNTVCRTPSCGRLKGKRQEPITPPAAQINQRLTALLEKSLHWLDDLCDAGPLGQQYPSDELTQFVGDIRAALAATQMRGDA